MENFPSARFHPNSAPAILDAAYIKPLFKELVVSYVVTSQFDLQ